MSWFSFRISLPDDSMEINVIIFGAEISSSVHFNNKRKDILIFVEGPTQGLDDITLTAEAIYPINLLYNQITDLY